MRQSAAGDHSDLTAGRKGISVTRVGAPDLCGFPFGQTDKAPLTIKVWCNITVYSRLHNEVGIHAHVYSHRARSFDADFTADRGTNPGSVLGGYSRAGSMPPFRPTIGQRVSRKCKHCRACLRALGFGGFGRNAARRRNICIAAFQREGRCSGVKATARTVLA